MSLSIKLILTAVDHLKAPLQGIASSLGAVEVAAREADQEVAAFNARWAKTTELSRKIGIGLSTAGAAMMLYGRRVTMAASSVEEMESKFDAVFKATASGVREWSKTQAESVNRSDLAFRRYLSTLQDTFVPLGFSRQAAGELSKALVTLTVDVASFNDVVESDVLANFQGALIGEVQAVRKFGIIINEAAMQHELLRMGIEGGVQAATEMEKVQARVNLLIQGTADAQGDAARTSESFANRLRGTSASFERLEVAVGTTSMAIASSFLPAITSGAELLARVAVTDAGKTFIGVGTGAAVAAIALGPIVTALPELITGFRTIRARGPAAFRAMIGPGAQATAVLIGVSLAVAAVTRSYEKAHRESVEAMDAMKGGLAPTRAWLDSLRSDLDAAVATLSPKAEAAGEKISEAFAHNLERHAERGWLGKMFSQGEAMKAHQEFHAALKSLIVDQKRSVELAEQAATRTGNRDAAAQLKAENRVLVERARLLALLIEKEEKSAMGPSKEAMQELTGDYTENYHALQANASALAEYGVVADGAKRSTEELAKSVANDAVALKEAQAIRETASAAMVKFADAYESRSKRLRDAVEGLDRLRASSAEKVEGIQKRLGELAEATREAQEAEVESHQRGIRAKERGEEDYARAVESAAKRVEDARRQVVDANRSLEDAEKELQRTVESTTETMARTERDSAEQVVAVRRRQAEQTKRAQERVEELQRRLNRDSLGELNEQQRQAFRREDLERSLAKARGELRQTEMTSLEEVARAERDAAERVGDAQKRSSEARETATDRRRQMAEALQRAEEMSAQTAVEAGRQVSDAERSRAEVYRGVTEAIAQSAKGRERAIETEAEAHREAAKEIADSNQRIQEAERDLGELQIEQRRKVLAATADLAEVTRDLNRAELLRVVSTAQAERGGPKNLQELVGYMNQVSEILQLTKSTTTGVGGPSTGAGGISAGGWEAAMAPTSTSRALVGPGAQGLSPPGGVKPVDINLRLDEGLVLANAGKIVESLEGKQAVIRIIEEYQTRFPTAYQ